MQTAPLKLAPDTFDRVLASAALILLVAVTTALVRGRAEWHEVPPFIWAHIATIFIAVALTPVMLLRRRGDKLHRQLGWVWAAAMFLTALLTFGIRINNSPDLSLIHILSAITLSQVPVIIWSARTHKVELHRRSVRGMVTGALIIAGIFTFPFERLMSLALRVTRPLRGLFRKPPSAARRSTHHP